MTVKRIVMLMLMLSVVTVTAPIAVQAQDNTTSTTETPTVGETQTQGNYAVDIDSETRITEKDYNADNQTLTLTINNLGDTSERVLIAQAVEAGAGRMAFRDMTVYSDRTVTLRGIPDAGGDPIVMVATETSLEDGNIEWITTGSQPLSEQVTLAQGLGIGIITMGSMTGLMAWRKRNKSGEEPENPFDDSGVF